MREHAVLTCSASTPVVPVQQRWPGQIGPVVNENAIGASLVLTSFITFIKVNVDHSLTLGSRLPVNKRSHRAIFEHVQLLSRRGCDNKVFPEFLARPEPTNNLVKDSNFKRDQPHPMANTSVLAPAHGYGKITIFWYLYQLVFNFRVNWFPFWKKTR